jgi:hypothetical protein
MAWRAQSAIAKHPARLLRPGSACDACVPPPPPHPIIRSQCATEVRAPQHARVHSAVRRSHACSRASKSQRWPRRQRAWFRPGASWRSARASRARRAREHIEDMPGRGSQWGLPAELQESGARVLQVRAAPEVSSCGRVGTRETVGSLTSGIFMPRRWKGVGAVAGDGRLFEHTPLSLCPKSHMP